LSEFYINKGGDCDDWARVFFASFNYIKSIIKGINPQNKINLFTHGGSCVNKQTFFLTNSKDWYVEDCIINLENYEYAYPICGIKIGDTYGHCWVAFSENEINLTSDVNNVITKSIIIEPQTGEYVFSYPQSILQNYNYYVLMTNEDLIMKTTNDDSSWKGYIDYYDEVQNNKENIITIINNLN
jgi:hypothetical protein